MDNKKLVYIISDINKSLAFEWIAENFNRKFKLFFVLIGAESTDFSAFLRQHQIRYEVVSCSTYKSLLQRWMRIFVILKRERPDIIHTHLWRATLIGLSVGWILRVRKRIFTRHHALVHHVDFPSGLKWDKLCNSIASRIVAISASIKDILVHREGADPRKVEIIHHGFDLQYFRNVELTRVEQVKATHNLPIHKKPVIGVISRYVHWKGVQFIIEAFWRVRKEFPEAHLVLANAHGTYEGEVRLLLSKLPEESYTEISFENDLAALYHTFDVFVHIPVDPYVEAFGQTYVEALAAGIPSVFTLSGIAREFIHNEHNALVVPFKDSEATARAIAKILTDDRLKWVLINNGINSVDPFSLDQMLAKLEVLYA